MGLDNIAYKKESLDDELFKGCNVGYGNQIRGKAYSHLIQEVSNHDLYKELDADEVHEIAADLSALCVHFKRCIEENDESRGFVKRISKDDMGQRIVEWWYPVDKGGEFEEEFTYENLIDLALWFKIVSDNDGCLHAWY